MSRSDDQLTSHLTEPELFSRPKRGPACSSEWARTQRALGLLPPEARRGFDAHLTQCPDCQMRWNELEAETAEEEPVPAVLLARARTLEPRPGQAARRLRNGVAILSALAAAMFWAQRSSLPARDEETRLKGALPVRAAVWRRGEDAPSEVELGHARLRAGDRLRLRVDVTAGRGVLVQGWEAGTWADYFEGETSGDWLPVGIDVTGDGQTRLRVVTCATTDRLAALPTEVRSGARPLEGNGVAGCLERRVDL